MSYKVPLCQLQESFIFALHTCNKLHSYSDKHLCAVQEIIYIGYNVVQYKACLISPSPQSYRFHALGWQLNKYLVQNCIIMTNTVSISI